MIGNKRRHQLLIDFEAVEFVQRFFYGYFFIESKFLPFVQISRKKYLEAGRQPEIAHQS